MSMFCYQCQQTAGGTGCTLSGVCGKDIRTAHLQDLLTAWCKQIAATEVRYRELGNSSRVVDRFLLYALFSTLTNVNFDSVELARQVILADRVMQLAEYLASEKSPAGQKMLEEQVLEPIPDPDEEQIADFVEQAKAFSIQARQADLGATVTGLQELVLYGIRGVAAYAWHAIELSDPARQALDREIRGMKERVKELKSRDPKDRELKKTLQKDIAAMETDLSEWESRERELLDGLFAELAMNDETTETDRLMASALKVGELNLSAMQLLEKAHISLFGTPEPTSVRTTAVAGKCVLISGHDLGDLAELLRQTEGTGINVYTHGEMLPAHGYPFFKKFKHLVGHYGTAWQNQQKEFDAFPGAILMTTNCIMKPQESYHDYIFTTGPVAWPGVKTIPTKEGKPKDFSPLIQAALDSSGYFKTKPVERVTVGFGADSIIRMSDQIFRAIEKGHLRRFFLIGGCDGAQQARSYFTDLAEKVPDNCVILTLGCGKYRFNALDFPPLANALPRLWDMGQCNDAYSAIRLLGFFTEKFGCGVNELPVSIFLSWFEQKAVAVLLSLLYLDIRNIRLGPTLPAFLTSEAVALLNEKYGIAPVSADAQTDLDAVLNPPQ